ncbi:ATP-grasp domain-containing protein [Herpetosiphon gulosus]|uniref:carboxylate--amine ligase n=1 Tax=Herpetosiphon gulosus TaxID=1973496 RepID=UPI0031EC6B6A
MYPHPRNNPEKFVDFLLDYLHKKKHDVLFPTDDITLQLCARYRDDFEKVTHVPIPGQEQVMYGLDKAKIVKILRKLNIPHPQTSLPRTLEQAQLAAVRLGGDVIIKPRTSSAGRGIAYVKQAHDVAQQWYAIHQTYPYPMIQQRVPSGTKFDVCVIMDKRGEAICSFVQKEIRHFPVVDGLSTVQESVWLPELVEQTVALLREIGWYGLAEVEYMQNSETGELMFMEINPRFWASVQLAISSGIDFPAILYQVARDQPVPQQHHYTVGLRCRWLFPGDLLHYLTNPKRHEIEPPFFQFRDPNTVYDGISRDDWRATLGVFVSFGHYVFDPDLWQMIFRRRKQHTASTPPLLFESSVSDTYDLWDELGEPNHAPKTPII